MTNLEERFIQLLADPSINPKERRELAKNLQTKGLDIYLEQARKLSQRSEIMPVIKNQGSKGKQSTPRKTPTKKGAPRPGRETVPQQVARLLRKEAKMTVTEAIIALSSFLKTKRPDAKRSFDWQVDRLIKAVNGSMVLHAAYRIRNEKTQYVSKSAWPLEQ